MNMLLYRSEAASLPLLESFFLDLEEEEDVEAGGEGPTSMPAGE